MKSVRGKFLSFQAQSRKLRRWFKSLTPKFKILQSWPKNHLRISKRSLMSRMRKFLSSSRRVFKHLPNWKRLKLSLTTNASKSELSLARMKQRTQKLLNISILLVKRKRLLINWIWLFKSLVRRLRCLKKSTTARSRLRSR